MEAYHAPFTSKYRFWPGFLLLVHASLCLIDALNTSTNPQVAFTSITFTVGIIIFLKGIIGHRIYKKWTYDVLEMAVLFNLFFFAVFMWYTFDTQNNQAAIAYISICLTFVMLLLVVIYHVYEYSGLSSRIKQKNQKLQSQEVIRMNVSTDALDINYENQVTSPPSFSVVESPVTSSL